MDKASQRKAAKALRASLSAEERKEAAESICEKLTELTEIKNASVILSYMAIGDEADLSLINEKLENDGKKLCYPVSQKGGIMHAFAPGRWRAGLYGIKEPDPDFSELVEPEEISIVLAPCLGFDEKGNRLGYGGGYYDRFLPSCVNAEIIACAYEIQKLPELAADSLDCRIHMAVTEKNIYKFQNRN